jgi:DNA-binding transcriptional ArsR family regulator
MEREFLEEQLAAGRSLEQIGRLVGRDPSTVGYWVRKHGLAAVHRERHRSRGGIARATLEQAIAMGASTREIADDLGLSRSTVSHWLRTYELSTQASVRRRQARAAHRAERELTQLVCPHHGLTDYLLEGRGNYRCLKCRGEAVARRRRKVKAILAQDAGGCCQICGYARCISALHFHHLDPSEKAFEVSGRGWTRALDRVREEVRKCVLLCGNCHAEVEAGVATLPPRSTPHPE